MVAKKVVYLDVNLNVIVLQQLHANVKNILLTN